MNEQPENARILDTYQNIQNSQEVAPVSIQATHEYLALIWKQYQEASWTEKSRLLDEIVKNTNMHRKAATRLMNKKSKPQFKRGAGKTVNAYSDASKVFLKKLWKDMGYLGSVRLKGAIPIWIEHWDNKDLDDYSRIELKTMSVSTIERTLKEEKANLRRRLNTGTKRSNSKPKVEIPIRDLSEKPTELGHCEIDCVAHCGGSLTGSHVWTLTLTDIISGQTECEALLAKNGFEVELALREIEKRLPFKITTLYMDNGSEFLNGNIYNRYAKRLEKIERAEVIKLFRSRPYKKNDQCFVEQKNYTHVRELFGYDRYSGKLMVTLMNNIYRNEARKLWTYFHPQIRLKEKIRVGSKVKRKFHAPATPFETMKKHLSKEKAQEMQIEMDKLNPFKIRKKLRSKLRDFQTYNQMSPDDLGKYAI